MTTTIPAVYADGVFRPMTSPPLIAEGSRVNLTFDVVIDEEAVWERMSEAKSVKEMRDLRRLLPSDAGDYDLDRPEAFRS